MMVKTLEAMLGNKKSLKSIVLYLKMYYRRLEIAGNIHPNHE